MKKLIYMLAVAAFAVSCSKEPGIVDEPDPPVLGGDIGFEAVIAEGGTASGDLSPETIGLVWGVGDEVSVLADDLRTPEKYKVTETANGVAGLAGGLDWSESGASRTFYAFRNGAGFSYPDVLLPGPDFTTTGVTADHIATSFLLVASPKKASQNGDESVGLKFYNTMSVVEFRLATTEEAETISRIEIVAANGVFAVDGKTDIKAAGLSFGKISASEYSKKASLTITGTPSLPVVANVENPSETVSFLLPVVAAGASGEMSVNLTTSKGVKEFKADPVTFEAGKHYTMTLVSVPAPEWVDNYPLLPELYTLGLGPDKNGETILDFSRVGYKWGDEAIPSPAVVKTISPPAGGADASDLINNALAAAHSAGGGVVFLEKGEYRVGKTIKFEGKKNVVLRGAGSSETDGTRIIATSTAAGFTSNEPTNILISMRGGAAGPNQGSTSAIVDDYVPAGRFWVRVTDPTLFAVGQDVVVKRNITDQWITDLKMTGHNGWEATKIDRKHMERVVTKIDADTLWFENPLSICIESKYGGGSVYRYSYPDRIEGCGVEDMFLTTVSTGSTDENHASVAIYLNRAQHCWVRNVTSTKFAFTGVGILQYAKNITVENCKVLDMHSVMTGSRRYPFLIKGQLSLVKDCYCETARHAYSTSSPTTNGPNVFVNCSAKTCYSDNGPHQRMASGTLYDNIKIEKTGSLWSAGVFAFMDRGTVDGHGWTELNGVLWNIETDGGICVQKPPVSGTNYGVGCVGPALSGYPGVGTRDQGTIVSKGTHVTTPKSLYEAQLAFRKEHRPGGVMDVR